MVEDLDGATGGGAELIELSAADADAEADEAVVVLAGEDERAVLDDVDGLGVLEGEAEGDVEDASLCGGADEVAELLVSGVGRIDGADGDARGEMGGVGRAAGGAGGRGIGSSLPGEDFAVVLEAVHFVEQEDAGGREAVLRPIG